MLECWEGISKCLWVDLPRPSKNPYSHRHAMVYPASLVLFPVLGRIFGGCRCLKTWSERPQGRCTVCAQNGWFCSSSLFFAVYLHICVPSCLHWQGFFLPLISVLLAQQPNPQPHTQRSITWVCNYRTNVCMTPTQPQPRVGGVFSNDESVA